MSSNQTTNYQLPIWAAEDKFQREEFNEANQKLDNALAQVQQTLTQKADGTAVTAIQNTLSGKADSVTVTQLQQALTSTTATLRSEISTAAGSKTQIAFGSYTIPTAQVGKEYHVSVGFRPKAVLIWKNQVFYRSQSSCTDSALVLDGYPLKVSDSQVIAKVDSDGFILQQQLYDGSEPYYPHVADSSTHLYIAFS